MAGIEGESSLRNGPCKLLSWKFGFGFTPGPVQGRFTGDSEREGLSIRRQISN